MDFFQHSEDNKKLSHRNYLHVIEINKKILLLLLLFVFFIIIIVEFSTVAW